jgi:hypothetical protein
VAKQETITVECPNCGEECRVKPAPAIKHDDEKTLKKLFEGTLNKFTCKACGIPFALTRPLVYKDWESVFIAYYVDLPDNADLQTFEQEIDVMATDVFQAENLPRPTVRLTVTLPDFIEKIILHRMGLDDRLIEFAKHQLFKNLGEDKLNPSEHRLLIDFSNKDEDKLAFIIYDRETNQPISALHVPKAEFDSLVKEFTENEQLLAELDTLFPSCYVSVERLFG